MANGPEFPAFLKIEVGPDAKSTLLAELGQMAGDGKRQFEQAFGEVGQIIQRSVASIGRGGLNLDLDSAGLRQAAADAELALQKLTLLQSAAQSLIGDSRAIGAEFGNVSAATVKYAQAIDAQVNEAQRASQEARAQVEAYDLLQTRVTALAAKNEGLAQSYRAVYEQQAKSENFASNSQRIVNAVAAPGLDPFNAATRNGATFSALAGMLEENEAMERQAAVAAAAAAQIEILRQREEAAARGADILAQAHAGTALELGRTTKSARESAAAFEALLSQQEKQSAQAAAAAAAAQQELAASAAQLRAQLDPALAVQQRFDAELARADQLLEAGAISTKEYAQAQALARQNLNESWGAITRSNAAQEQLNQTRKKGTTETSNVINGVRAERTAFTQLGQQMQDVVIQAQMGTSALTIFTQQVPQAAFALSGLADSANKTKAAVGNVATFLSGPWGAAIFAATAIMGPFILSLFKSGDAAEDAKGKTYDFSKSLDILSLSAKEATNAMQQLEQASRSAISVQGDFVEQQAATTAAAIADIEGRLAKSQKQLAEIKALNQGAGLSLLPDSDFSGQAKLQAQIATDQEALAKLKLYRTNYEIALSQRRINEAMDAGTRATGEYRRAIGKLEERRIKSEQDPIGATAAGIFLSEQQYQAEYARITKLKDDALEAQKKVKQKTPAATKENMLAQFAMPFPASSISSGFGKRSRPMDGASTNHGGIDFAQPMGAAVKAPQVGVVKSVGFSPTLGKYVVIDHGAGTQTRYGHLSDNSMVREGDAVAKGDVIGKVGSTGRSTGPHLHYEVLVNGKKVDPTKGLFPIDEVKVQENVDRAIEAQMRAYQQIAEEQARSRDSVEGMLIQQERQIEIQELLIQGRESEADALELQYRVMDQLGIKDAELLDTALEIAGIRRETYDQMQRNLLLQRQQNREEEEARRLQQRNLQAIAGIKDSIARTIYEIPEKGIGAIGGFFDRLQDQFRQDLADALTESLFGDAFKSAEETLRDAKKVEADSSLSAARALNTLARAADKAAVAQSGGIAGVPSSIAAGLRVGVAAGARAANDNEAAITVIAQRLQDFSDPRRLYAMAFEKLGEVVFGPEKAKMFGQAVGSALEGAAYGQMGGGIVGARSTEGKIGSSIGGMLGQEAGKSIFKALGSFAGPLGGLIGGALGGLFGGLFKKTTSGAVSLGVNQFGAAGISNTIGNSAAIQKEATGYGGAVAGSLNRIAEQLGGVVGDFSVAIGKRSSGWIKVSASGNAQATTGKKVTSDIIYNGKDEAEAIRAALLNAIQDGAIKGIREGAQRLLKAGSDIEAQLQKAMDFQSVFDRLKAYKDPVGAALDTLNREFEKLKRTFAEAGASAAEYAELEELYGIERAKAIKEAAQRVTGSLQALFDDLMIGDTGLSLRDRQANAKAAYDPLAARVAAGDVSAYDDYVKAAQALLDIERQISGSTQAYFDRRDEIARLTKTQIDAQQARIDAATNSDSPFSNSQATGDNQAIIEALDRLGNSVIDGLGGKLDAVNDNLGALIMAGSGRTFTLPALSYENYF